MNSTNLRQNFELAHLCMITIKETGELITKENLHKLENMMMKAILNIEEEMASDSDNHGDRKAPEQNPDLDMFEGSWN